MRSEPPITYTALLTSHVTANNSAVREIEVRMGWSQIDTLMLSYALTGDCTRLQIPESRPQAQVDGLWQHTCFELFVSAKDSLAYWEFNFSPSREWAIYQFRGYRDRIGDSEMNAPPKIETRRTVDHLNLDVRLPLPLHLTARPLRVGLSAVIEDSVGKLSYWALQHPSEKPDFHHPNAFALEITPPQQEPTKKDN